MRISREELLSQLESVQPGLCLKDIIEQTSSFIFKKKKIVTYNDEISCSIDTTLDVEGAVRAMAFISILNLLKEKDIDVTQNETELLIKSGKNKLTEIVMDNEIALPIDKVEKPNRWYPLSEDFCDAIELVRSCAGKKANEFASTCVHIHPKYIEASDNVQIARYPLKTKVHEGFLIVGDTLKYVAESGATDICKMKSWVHFRNKTGLVISCRYSTDDDYPELGDALDVSGAKSNLRKGLAEAAFRTKVFSAENQVRDRVTIKLKGNRLLIRGEGSSGRHTEQHKIHYTGKPITFTISPEVLIDIVGRNNECHISKNHLMIDTGAYVYVTCLGILDGATS